MIRSQQKRDRKERSNLFFRPGVLLSCDQVNRKLGGEAGRQIISSFAGTKKENVAKLLALGVKGFFAGLAETKGEGKEKEFNY